VLCQVLYRKALVSCLNGFSDSKVVATAQVSKWRFVMSLSHFDPMRKSAPTLRATSRHASPLQGLSRLAFVRFATTAARPCQELSGEHLMDR
jgi:hypothetical protein